eukprot:gene8315-9167_t
MGDFMNSFSFQSTKWSKESTGEVLIAIAVILFGVDFIGQRYAMLHGIGPFTYNACRYVISTLFLCLIKYGFGVSSSYDQSESAKTSDNLSNKETVIEMVDRSAASRDLWIFGVAIGVVNFAGSILQQIGLVTVSAGKTGFITGMYVVIVPIAEYIIPGFNPQLGIRAWSAVGMSFVGLFLLSGCAGHEKCFGEAIKEGEVLVFIGMLCWMASILLTDVASKKTEVITLTLIDFATTTIITLVLALYFEPEAWAYPFPAIRNNWLSIVVVGVCAAGSFTLSTLGQMYTPPTRAALIYSMEAVVGAIFAFLILGEVLSIIEIIGGALMFAAAVVSSYDGIEEEEVKEGREGTMEEGRPLLLLGEQKGFNSI